MTPLCDLLPIVLAAVRPAARRSWRTLWPTQKQIAVLRDRGYPVPATRGEAADLIATVLARPGATVVRTEGELRAAMREPWVFRSEGGRA